MVYQRISSSWNLIEINKTPLQKHFQPVHFVISTSNCIPFRLNKGRMCACLLNISSHIFTNMMWQRFSLIKGWFFPVRRISNLEAEMGSLHTAHGPSQSWIQVEALQFPSYCPMAQMEPNVCVRFSSAQVCCLFWLGWNVSGGEECSPWPSV